MTRIRISNSHQTRESWTSPSRGEILVRVQACCMDHVEPARGNGASQPWTPVGGTGAAGTVIRAGEAVTRFAVGDQVFGHFPAEAWIGVQAPCARLAADGPHVERQPAALDPLEAAALAEGGLTAKTILRTADLRPGQTAVVIGATTRTGAVLVPLLAEGGVEVIAGARPEEEEYVRWLGAADTIEPATPNPVAAALSSHPDLDLLVDLVSFGEPYFVTAAGHGTIVTARPLTDKPGIPRVAITAEPGDLAVLAQRTLERFDCVEPAGVHLFEEVHQILPVYGDPEPALAS